MELRQGERFFGEIVIMTEKILSMRKGDPGVRRNARRSRSKSRSLAAVSLSALAMGAMLTGAHPASAQMWDPTHHCDVAPCAPVTAQQPGFDFTNTANYTNTKPLAKFVDALPSIPVATPDTLSYPGSDYYEISVEDYNQKLHSALNASRLRGYRQTNKIPTLNGKPVVDPAKPAYLGPLIVASRNQPVRIKLTNNLGSNKFFMPVDDTVMGASDGPPVRTNGAGGPVLIRQAPAETKALGVPTVCTKDEANNLIPGVTCASGTYSKNRAELHLHGVFGPWISDGTPDQWVTPAGVNELYSRGLSFQNVPDMPAGVPGDGVATYYYPNEQSGRLMFYHDHSLGITRLNVYAGEAAGYLLTDDQEQSLFAPGAVLEEVCKGQWTTNRAACEGVPLVIQDKTFVNAAKIANDDPLWVSKGFGSGAAGPVDGDLWFPHVYVPNQMPTVNSMNPLGRWDYSPWVSPPFMIFKSKLPDTSIVPEAFMDTMVVNGGAYPYMDVGRKPVRLRILNASNERMLNLQLYYATTGTGTFGPAPSFTPAPGVKCNSAAYPASQCTEVKMVPATGALIKNVPAKYASGGLINMNVPVDNRAGGVPDPLLQGPPFIQIGNEGGLLPKPVVHHMRSVDYDMDTKSITIANVRNYAAMPHPRCNACNYPYPGYSLFVGPAERADIIVDFTDVPDGSTLILYNDAPAANPAFDARYDIFTGGPNLAAIGGPASSAKGYGPNTRTVMQFRVNSRTKGVSSTTAKNRASTWVNVDPTLAFPFNTVATGDLANALATAYANSHDLVANPALQAKNPSETAGLLPTCDPANPATCGDTRMCTFQRSCLTGRTEFPSCTGYYPGRALDLALGNVAGIPAASIPAKYASTLDATGLALAAQGTENYGLPHYRDNTPQGCGYPIQTKSISENFDSIYGRMNAQLGTETPALDAAGQQTFGFFYPDPATEQLDEGETQIWNIVHNGVDTHTTHFHLTNVQVINRVDWAGVVKPADANERGWKETVIMNPLENVVLAVRGSKPLLPFNIPLSYRPRDVNMALNVTNPNAQLLFPFTFGNTTTNQYEDLQWEYVWHCHLLGHEENDMMRPIVMVPAGNVYTPTGFVTP
jgi:FtsP/CotA-like multicopper oxidase with cupredoxin domain